MKDKNNIIGTIRALLVFSFLAVTMSAYGAGPVAQVQIKSLDERTGLDGPWKIQPGDDQRYAAAEFNDASWETVPLPGSFMPFVHKKNGGTKGIVWLRK